MPILQRYFERRGESIENIGTASDPSVTLLNLLGGGKTAAGMTVDEKTSEGIPAIYACVHVISETTGQLPLKLMRKLEKGKEPATSHPLYSILHDLPNPEQTAYQFREQMTRHLAIWGRAYAQIRRNTRGDVTALWPLHPARMFVDRDELQRKRYRYWMGKGEYATFVVTDPMNPPMLHLHINSEDGLDGRSPIMINKETIGVTKAAESFTASWFQNGAVPGIALTVPKGTSDKAVDNIREGWLSRFMGASKANKLAILREGITATILGVDPQKSQLNELASMQIEQAARIYRVPLHFIGHMTKSTSWGSGLEELGLGLVNFTMMPWWVQWQQAIARDLLTKKSFETHEAMFVVNALVRGDITKRFNAYALARQNGWMNGNEIRELEDMNPIEGGAGELFWISSGAQPLMSDGMPAMVEPEPEPEPKMPDMPEPDGVM